jgi:hypothetical protein
MPEDSTLHNHRCENLKSYNYINNRYLFQYHYLRIQSCLPSRSAGSFIFNPDLSEFDLCGVNITLQFILLAILHGNNFSLRNSQK